MLPALTIGPSSHRTRWAQLSELLLNVVGLCFWKGAWSSSQVLKSSLVARADRPHSAAATPLIQRRWTAAAKSQICPLESWEKPQGMPAVILRKNMLPRGKTQPLFAEEGPNPALVPHDCPRLPGLMLMSWCRAGASPSGHPCPGALAAWSLASPRWQVRSQRKAKPGLHSKLNGTQLNHNCDAKHRFAGQNAVSTTWF